MDIKLLSFVLMLYIKEVVLNTCETHKSCADCIQDPSVCKWCAAKNVNVTRCMAANADDTWCEGYIQNPESSSLPNGDLDFNSTSGALVQIKPQTYNLNLRPGQPKDFHFAYKGVQDYPVDLYFLFDASNTMKSLANHTAVKAENIYNTMKNMTQDVFMGLGTFVDKNTLPYTQYVVANKSYSFRHHLSLRKNYTEFRVALENAPHGINRDAPEGSLDALAQALACEPQIGWRKESRKILILLTDGYYHSAGDGKAGGIFTPYDGECYTENGIYTKELEMDYPSVGMINKLVIDNKVIVVFVVPGSKQDLYESLSKEITGSKLLLLKSTSEFDDMVPKLKGIYEDISRNIKLNVNVKSPGRPKHFNISFSPNCLNSESCEVTMKEIKKFNATITLLKYDDYEKTEIDVTIRGINEKLTLNVNVIKDCDCKPEPNSDYCNKNTIECGICHCAEPSFGNRCQCSRNVKTTSDNTGCNYNGTICNGHGICSCGVCSCYDDGFVGPYCQCPISACPLHDRKPCGGHGVCQCDGICQCDAGYTGNACQCFNSDSACTKPGHHKVCDNRGVCECGSCKCEEIASWDKRLSYDDFCVIYPSPERHSLQCESLTSCVVCLLNEGETCPCPEHHTVTIVDKISAENDTDWHFCSSVRVDVGCYTNYTYKYDEDVYGIQLILQKEKDCAMSYYLYGGIFLVTLLVVGILTLVGWKLCTDYRDKQEYNKFLEDHKSEISPCDNPLYVPAQTCFRNPAFRKRSIM